MAKNKEKKTNHTIPYGGLKPATPPTEEAVPTTQVPEVGEDGFTIVE